MTRPIEPIPLSGTRNPVDLSGRSAINLHIVPNAGECSVLAQQLGLLELRKVRLQGTLSPLGKRDWRLDAQLGATVVQPCVVTLEPVTTRVEEPVERIWRAQFETFEPASEVEMDDDTSEVLPHDGIDLSLVLSEALALALPVYPRREDAQLDHGTFAASGTKPMSDEDARPFAELSALRDKLSGSTGDGSED